LDAQILKPFVAMIGPPRLVLGLFALAFGVFGIATDTAARGSFDWTRNIKELIALAFSCLNIGEEVIKSFLRRRFSIVEMDSEGIFDRRIMRHKLSWEDIEWVDPQPAGLPDRLRVKADTQLTAFGRVRNLLIRVIRRIPKGEIVITFGGLNKAASQATTWIADNKSGFVPDVWKSVERSVEVDSPTEHDAVLIGAGLDPREWVGWIVGGVLLVALLAGVLPALFMTLERPESYINLPIWAVFVASFVLVGSFWFGAFAIIYRIHKQLGNNLIVISRAGFSDPRISSQFIGWQDVESVSFEYRDAGRLINEAAPISVQFREGLKLMPPASKFFWPFEMMRRIMTPELRVLSHYGTATSVSEIIETLQRHDVPVAIREIARG
jgi:hypothetical protein